MAITKKYVNETLRTVLVLSALLSTALAVDCNGKSFHCVNSTHFMICVDLGGGVSQAIDNFFIACPPPTICQGNNHFECEFPAPVTLSTTISDVIRDTTLPWEEVVTKPSPGKATKEYSENYMNTERITTAAEYSTTTTDKTLIFTEATASEFYVTNELNIPEIVPTLAAKIATNATETTETVNENQFITEYVPIGVVDIRSDVMDTVTGYAVASTNLTDTELLFVDDITTAVSDTTTENLIITDTIAAQTEYVPTVVVDVTTDLIEPITQYDTERNNLLETEPVVVNDITTAVVETTSENIIITDTTAAKTEHIAPWGTEQIPQAINDNLNITEYVPIVVVDITTDVIEPVTQSVAINKNFIETDPMVVNDVTTAVVETTTENIITKDTIAAEMKFITDTTAAETEHIAPWGTEQIPQAINDNLNITEYVPIVVVDITTDVIEPVTQSVAISKNFIETDPMVVNDVTTAVVETTTENIITKDTIAAEMKFITDTTAAETEHIAQWATEQIPQAINDNLNITEYVPIVVVDITTDVIEPVTQSVAISKNFIETDPMVVNDVTTAVVETTTENIITKDTIAAEMKFITDTTAAETEHIAPWATEQIPQAINDNLNITEYVPIVVVDITTDVIEPVTQSVAISKNFIETDPMVVNDVTTAVVETTTENIITKDTIAAEMKFNASSSIEPAPPTTNDRPNITGYVSTVVPDITTDVIETVTESTAAKNSLTETEPAVVDNVTTAFIETTTESIIIETEYIAPWIPEQVSQTKKDTMNITEYVPADVTANITTTIIVTPTATESANIIENEHVTFDNITTTIIETTTDNIVLTDILGIELGHVEPSATEAVTQTTNETDISRETFKSERVNVSEPLKQLTSIDGSVPSNTSIVVDNQRANEKENNESQIPTINDLFVSHNSAATKNSTEAVETTIDKRIDGYDISTTTSHTNSYTKFTNAPTEQMLIIMTSTQNNAGTTVLDETWTETGDNGARTDQPTKIKEILTTGSTQNAVTQNVIISTSQPVNLEMTTTGDVPITVSNAQPMLLALDDNFKNELPSPETQNIVSAVSNGENTNGSMTEAVDIPTTISNVQPVPPDFEDNMKILAPLDNGTPATENIVTVNNKVDTNKFTTERALDLDEKTTDDTPTTVGNGQAPAFENIITTEAPLSVVSSLNTGASTNGFKTPQPLNINITNTQAIHIPTAISNAQPMAPISEDNVTTNVPLPATENILSSVNNEVSRIGSATAQEVNVDIINTEAMHIATSISDTPSMAPAFEDNMKNGSPLPRSENIVSTVNNGASTNSITRAQTANVPATTINDVPATAPDFDEGSKAGKAVENVKEQSSVHNAAISHTNTSLIPIKDDIVKATTANSIPSSFDSAFDISNLNSIRQQSKFKTKQANNNQQPSTVEHNDQADNIIRNPLTNLLLNNGNLNSESIGTSSVANLNGETSEKIAASLSTDFDSQNTTPSLVITSHEREPSIESITTVVSIGGTGSNDILATSGLAKNIAKVNSEPETTEVPVTAGSFILKTSADAFANDGIDFSSASTPLQTKKSVADTTIHSTGSATIKIDNTLIKSRSNGVVSSDIQEITNTKSNKGPFIVISNTSVIKPEVKSFVKEAGDIDSPTVVHDKQFELRPSTHGLAVTTRVGPPLKGNKINEEDNTISKPVILDVLPLPINNIKFSKSTTNTPILKDLTSLNQVENTIVTSVSYESQSLKPNFADSGQLDSVNVGYIRTAPRFVDPALKIKIGITDRPRHATTVAAVVQHSIPNSQAKTVSRNGNANFTSQSKTIDVTDVLSPPSQHVEKIINKKACANNTSVIQDTKPSGSDTNTTHYFDTTTSSIYTQAQKISTAHMQMVAPNPSSYVNNKQIPTEAAITFSCTSGIRGRYSEKDDCRKFYICIGNNEPIVGYCPLNTVFSDLKKLCTRNMSHCIRENEFKCPSAGRFSDFIKDNVYYICVNHKDKLYRFKFQCQKGYLLDKTTVKCIETTELESNESASISSMDNSSQTNSNVISSNTSNKSTSSTNNSSSRADDSSGKNEEPKSKKRNEAKETSERKSGDDGDDDDEDEEVFRCKKVGKFPIRNECRRYYLCKKNRKSEYRRKIKKCDSGKVFHKDKKKCVDDDSYEC